MDEWHSTKVPGGQVKTSSDNSTVPGMKIIMSSHLQKFGQLSDAELNEYKTKFGFDVKSA